MLAAPACHFKYQSLRRQYAPQHFEYRLAVASDVRMIQAWIGFFGHPGSQQAVRCSRRKFVEQRLRLLQIERVETFGEPAVDGREKIASHIPLALIALIRLLPGSGT